MFNNNVQLGTVDFVFDNITGKEAGKDFSINGKLSIGLSMNLQVINKIEPLIDRAIKFELNKFVGKQKSQKLLDEVEVLELEIRKARLEKELESLRK